MATQLDKNVEVAFPRVGLYVGKVDVTKKHMDDSKGVKRFADSPRKSVWIDTACVSPFKASK